MQYRVVFTDPNQHTFEPELIDKLAAAGAAFETSPMEVNWNVTEFCRTADAIITSATHITKNVIEELVHCRVISRVGTGYDNIDCDAAAARGIPVTNVPGFCTEEVATHTMAMLLALHRRITTLDGEVRRGLWNPDHVLSAHRLSEKTLGIIGYGAIGQAVGFRAAAFGMRIVYFDVDRSPQTKPGPAIRCLSVNELLEQADFVSVHVPLDKDTVGLLNATTFRRMKRSSVLINTSRGAIVNEEDLINALEEGLIAGAALDVLQYEPPNPANPLMQMSNVLLTPHCASHSDNALREVRTRSVEEVVRALRGKPLLHVVNGVQQRESKLLASKA